MPKYEVPLLYKGQRSYIIEAETPEAAKDVAAARFCDGDDGVVLGNESEEFERFGEVTELPPMSKESSSPKVSPVLTSQQAESLAYWLIEMTDLAWERRDIFKDEESN